MVVGVRQLQPDVGNQATQDLQKETQAWLQKNSLRSLPNSRLQQILLPSEDGTSTKVEKHINDLRLRADAFYQRGELDQAVLVYQELIRALTQLQRPTETQIESLQKLRLQTASRLLALGESLTDDQQKVIATLLNDALRANPRMELLPSKYPPVLRKRFARARAHLAENQRVPLFIKTNPTNAVVFVEGRKVGLAPLQLLDALHSGTYRIWAEKDGVRSPTRTIQVHHQKVELELDFDAQFRFIKQTNTFVLPPKDSNLFSFCHGLSVAAGETPLLMVGEIGQQQKSVMAIYIDARQKEAVHFALTHFEHPQQRDGALRQSLNTLFKGTPQALTPNNPIDTPNTKAISIGETKPAISGASWALIGTSSVIVLGAVTAGFLLWPTQEPQGTLRVEVVP